MVGNSLGAYSRAVAKSGFDKTGGMSRSTDGAASYNLSLRES